MDVAGPGVLHFPQARLPARAACFMEAIHLLASLGPATPWGIYLV